MPFLSCVHDKLGELVQKKSPPLKFFFIEVINRYVSLWLNFKLMLIFLKVFFIKIISKITFKVMKINLNKKKCALVNSLDFRLLNIDVSTVK